MTFFQDAKHRLQHLIVAVLLCLPWPLAAGEYEQIRYGDQRVFIEYPVALSEAERQTIHRWLQAVTRALRGVHGELPMDRFRVTIKRSTSRSSPVPWGQVDRLDPARVLLVVNPGLGYQRLIDDWTAFHEFSHLLLPYRGSGDIWFSEGLATYYQNIVQARAGLLDERGMWQRIVAGFERGRLQQGWDHLSLSAVSNNLRENRQFMRVHWSGVLYWLKADMALRQQGKGSLDVALKRLKECCQTRSMSARAIALELDALSDSDIFAPLFDEYRNSRSLPEYGPVLEALGVKYERKSAHLVLDDNAPLAKLRLGIFEG